MGKPKSRAVDPNTLTKAELCAILKEEGIEIRQSAVIWSRLQAARAQEERARDAYMRGLDTPLPNDEILYAEREALLAKARLAVAKASHERVRLSTAWSEAHAREMQDLLSRRLSEQAGDAV